MVDPVLIAGAGHAGGRCALLLRHKGFGGRVVLVGEENFAPYERPPLSKGLLQGTREAAQCLLVPESEYAAQGIELMLGKRVQSISIEGSSAQLDSGESLEYDRLVIATGGLCRKMDCKGIDLNGIHDLRTMADSGSIKEFLEPGRNVVIVGGGFIGLETAACAIESGCNVHIVEAADSLLGRVLPANIAECIRDIHEAAGVQFHCNQTVDCFTGDNRVSSVWLSNGAKLPADMVVVGIGIEPAVQLASAAGLEVDNGVVTNPFCQTSNARVYAIGDCARNLNIRYNSLIRLESWQNAEQQADIAASHITGTHSPLQSVPWFWSDQYRYNIQMAGFPLEADDLAMRGSLDCGAVVYLGIKDGLLVGAVAIGEGTSAVRDLRVSQMLIEQRRPVDVSVLDDPDIKLKSLLK